MNKTCITLLLVACFFPMLGQLYGQVPTTSAKPKMMQSDKAKTTEVNGSESEAGMDEMWGESVVKLRAENAKRGQLFDEGNYAMFIHWGLYSQLGNKVDGKTYYGTVSYTHLTLPTTPYV